jgi:osmotically-inducible protein OsmY
MKTKLFFTAILISIASIGFGQKNIADQKIKNAIETEYQFDHAVNNNNVNIEVTDGIAELTGTVSNIKAKKRAANIAQMVKGVRSVSNRIDVLPMVTLGDKDIQSKVVYELINDPATESYEVNVSALDGIVTLTGEVDSYREKKLAENVAQTVIGVKQVLNNIEIEFDVTRSDSELKSEIEGALKWSKIVDEDLIDVKVKDAEVTLKGAVASAEEKENARYLAWVTGVESVDTDKLKVQWWAADTQLSDSKDLYYSDGEIEDAIEDAALFDPRVFSFEIEANATEGWVTLRGKVDNLKSRRAAENIARNTVGVEGVTNRIKVDFELPPTDNEVENNIENALDRNAITEAYEVDVDVNAGVATLTGTVDSYMEKMEAEWVASGITGVIGVTNTLNVNNAYSYYFWDATPYYDWYYVPEVDNTVITVFDPNDEQIKENVKSQLWWSPYVDSDDVKVTVENGEVELSGTVEDLAEFHKATENAWEGGAWEVDNNLSIE